jgi:hypothetical protein
MVSGARGRRATSVDVEPVAARSLKALLSHTITGAGNLPRLSIYAQPVLPRCTALAQFAILEATTTI